MGRKSKRGSKEILDGEIIEDKKISQKRTFNDFLNIAAKTVVNICMEIRRHESVLVIADPSTSEIGQELYKAASEISDNVLLVIMPFTRHHGDEPPISVAELMRTQNVVLAPTKFSITHTKARIQACKDGARIATMPGINSELFASGGMLADFNEIRDTISRVGVHLRRRRNIRVTSPEGTDIRFDVDPKKWNREDSGICNRPGMVTNLPAGKIFNNLIEGTSEDKAGDIGKAMLLVGGVATLLMPGKMAGLVLALSKRLLSFDNEVHYKLYPGQMHAFVSNIINLPTSIKCIEEISFSILKILDI